MMAKFDVRNIDNDAVAAIDKASAGLHVWLIGVNEVNTSSARIDDNRESRVAFLKEEMVVVLRVIVSMEVEG